MSNIPTVPGSEIVSTPQAAVHLDGAGIAAAGYRGNMAMAGAGEEVGHVAGSFANELFKARSAGIAASVDLNLRTARQTFLESLHGDSNEGWVSPTASAWKDRAQQVAQETREKVLGEHEHLPPGMKAELERGFRNWEGGLLLETQSLANVQMTNRAWAKTKEDYNDALKDGQGDHAMNLLQHARETKIANPEEVDHLEREIPRTIARNMVELGLATNPKGTLDLLKSGGALPATAPDGKPIVPKDVFHAKEYEQILNTARVRTSAWQNNNFQKMLGEDADPTTGFIPESSIDDKMKAGEIDEKSGRNLKLAQETRLRQTQARERAETAREAAAAARSDRDGYNVLSAKIHDPTAWSIDPDGYAHSMVADAASIVDPALRQRAINDANRQLAAVKKTGETAQSPLERQMIELMNRDKETNGAMVPMGVVDVPGENSYSFGGMGFQKKTSPDSTRYTHVEGGLSGLTESQMNDEQVQATFGAKREDVVEAVNVHAAKLQSEMREWFKTDEGRKATFEQANEHRKRLERPYVMAAVQTSLAKRAPAIVTTQEERDALPAGAPYSYNGQVYFKQ